MFITNRNAGNVLSTFFISCHSSIRKGYIVDVVTMSHHPKTSDINNVHRQERKTGGQTE